MIVNKNNNVEQNPFYRKTMPDYKYCFKKPAIKILLNDTNDYYDRTNATMNVGMRCNLYTLYQIKESDLLITDLLLGMNKKTRFVVNELTLLNPRLPVVCCLDFPFKNKIHVEIYPLIQRFILEDEFKDLTKENFKDAPLYTNGYICWVIAQIYATIFKDYADKAEIWGYCFRDLYIEQIGIHKNNLIKISITE